MSWPNKLSWRWIIRGTCLGLLVLCLGLWAVSYFYIATVAHNSGGPRGPLAGVWIDLGMLKASHSPVPARWRRAGWTVDCSAPRSRPPFSLHLLDGDFLGFYVGPKPALTDWYVGIPFWCPTVLLALVSWIAWRKTAQREPGRGFLIEPLASRRESAGG